MTTHAKHGSIASPEPAVTLRTALRPSGVVRDPDVRLGRAADPRVRGFSGFAVGRTDFWEPLVGWRTRQRTRESAVAEIARRYQEFVDVFERARAA